MGFSLYWDDEIDNVLHYVFPESWSWDDLSVMRKEIDRLIETRPRPGPVHFVANLSATKRIPFGAVGRARLGIAGRPKDVSHVYMVGAHPLSAGLIRTFQRIYPELGRVVTLCDTLDEARARIREALSRSNL